MGAIMALAPVGAPMIGGVLQSAFGWRSHFVLQIAFGLIAAFFVWRKLPETLRARAPGPFSLRAILAGYAEIMRNRAVLAYVGMLSVSFAGVFAWISGSSFVLQEIYGLSALPFGLAFAAASGGYLAGTALATRIVTRIGLDSTIGIGAVALGDRRARRRRRPSRSAARRRSRSSPRWRSTPSAWGWCSRNRSRAP